MDLAEWRKFRSYPFGFNSTDILPTLVTILFDEICKGLLSSSQAGFSTGKSCSLTLPDDTYIIIIRCPSVRLSVTHFLGCCQISRVIIYWDMSTKYKSFVADPFFGSKGQRSRSPGQITQKACQRDNSKSSGPIFTKFGNHMRIDETKPKVNYKFFVRGPERSLEVKRLISLKILLVLQIKTQDHQNWSMGLPNHAP